MTGNLLKCQVVALTSKIPQITLHRVPSFHKKAWLHIVNLTFSVKLEYQGEQAAHRDVPDGSFTTVSHFSMTFLSDFPSLFLIQFFFSKYPLRNWVERARRSHTTTHLYGYIFFCTLAIFCTFMVGSLLLHLSDRQEY